MMKELLEMTQMTMARPGEDHRRFIDRRRKSYEYHRCLSRLIIYAHNENWNKVNVWKPRLHHHMCEVLEGEMDGGIDGKQKTCIMGTMINGEEAIRQISKTLKGDWEMVCDWADVYPTL
jgi:hypothetical protein